MKNKPAYICFYLETYTYIALKGNDLLVYNTIDGKYIKCFVDMSCIKVFSYFINSKCYSQCIKKADMSKQLWKVIYSIRNKFMGNYFSMNSVSEVLPFSFRHYKIFCVNGNTGFRNESRIFYFIHLQNEEAYERKESSSA